MEKHISLKEFLVSGFKFWVSGFELMFLVLLCCET